MPRIMISATGTNCGKTSIVCGLLKILKDRGMNVKAYKCGPDYIDGMFHKEVLGVESSNLDSFFCNKDQLCALLDNDKDLNVIEGGMGFYDGVGFDDKGSCYDISKLTNTPVVLVINCKGMSSSIGATLRGFIEYRQDNQILGVIFNRLSPNLFEGCKEVALSLGIVPLGYIPDIKEGLFDSRYLGLVTPENIDEFNEKIELIAMYMSQYIDVDRLLKVAKCAPNKLVYEKPEVEKKYDCVVAIAKDEAFCFNYDDNVDMLRELGCTVKFFSPLEDSHIPEDADGLILSGGYPELYAKKLSENTELKNIDVIWSSSYTRAKATAKYIANTNNLPINLDSNLNERKLGNLKELGKFMKDKSTRDPSQEQLLDRNYKTSDGESAEDTRKRMNIFLNRILKEYEENKIAVVSHRGSDKILFIKLV